MLTSKSNKTKKKALCKSIGITIGDPCGIGPEVVAKALAHPSIRGLADFIVIGDAAVCQKHIKANYKNCSFIDCNSVPVEKLKIGKETALGGKAALTYLEKGVKLLKEKKIASLVTAPLSKEAISLHTHQPFKGHTEFLAHSFGVKQVEMMFIAGDLKMIIATRHIPLKEVPAAITKKDLYNTIQLTNAGLQSHFKIPHPKIGICGLNPHAGEGGKMGKEEIEIIIPVIKKALKNHIHVEGPFAADTIFTSNVYPKYDVIIAMYHDQGLVGVKTMCFNKLVNITLGLPFIRTSTAHGTAFNIAGKGTADPSSMCQAIKVAAALTQATPA